MDNEKQKQEVIDFLENTCTGAKMMGDEEVMLRASRALLAFKADVPSRRNILVRKPEPTPEEQWEKEYMRCLKAYLDYRIMLLEWKEKYRPKTRTEEWNDRFTTALRELVIVNYYLDVY